ELVAALLATRLRERLRVRVVDEDQAQERDGQVAAHAESRVAARALVHHVPRDRGDVLLAEPFEARDVETGMRRDPWHPVRVRLAERRVAAPEHHHVTGLDPDAGARGRLVQLPWRDRAPDRDEALRPTGRDVEQHTARRDPLCGDRIDWAPARALDGQAGGE